MGLNSESLKVLLPLLSCKKIFEQKVPTWNVSNNYDPILDFLSWGAEDNDDGCLDFHVILWSERFRIEWYYSPMSIDLIW